MSSPERRRHRRVKVTNLSAHVRVKNQLVGRGLPIRDISLGGLFVRDSHPLAAGTQVAVECSHVALKTPLILTGTTVVSVDPVRARAAGRVEGMGIRFGPLLSEVSWRLSRLLSTLQAPEAKAAPEPEPPWFFAPPIARPSPSGDRTLDPFAEVSALRPIAPAPAADPTSAQAAELGRLMTQVCGLLFDLDEARLELAQRTRELESLRSELEAVRTDDGRIAARLSELEEKLAPDLAAR